MFGHEWVLQKLVDWWGVYCKNPSKYFRGLNAAVSIVFHKMSSFINKLIGKLDAKQCQFITANKLKNYQI